MNVRDHDKTKERLIQELTALRNRIADLEKSAGSTKEPQQAPPGNGLPYRQLFETATDGIVLFAADTGLITEANQSFIDMSGHAPEELLGKRFWEIGPLRDIDAGLVVFQELQKQDHIYYDDLPFHPKGRPRIDVELSCSIHTVGVGRIIQCTVRDITRRKRTEEELWKAEARFRALFREAAVGIAILDIEGRITENNHKLEEILGYRETELSNRYFADFIHTEDKSVDISLFKELRHGGRENYQISNRSIRKDSTEVWGIVNASVVCGTSGEPLFIIRTLEDISERKRAEDVITRSRNFYLSLINALPNPIRLADVDGKCDYFNRAWLDFTGRTMSQELGDGWTRGVHPEDGERLMKRYRGAIAARSPYTTEYRLRSEKGAYRWHAEFGRPFNDIDGNFSGYISSCYDIHDRKTFEETLHSVSITDDLTGLLNRRGFFALAEQQLKIANRSRKGAVLFYADLDGLKAINDNFGHPEGDQALVEVALILRVIFRESDIIARLGGDEFAALLLENNEIQDEALIMNRLQECVSAHNENPGRRYALSISAGIKRYHPDRPALLDELLSEADKLMYERKRKKPRL